MSRTRVSAKSNRNLWQIAGLIVMLCVGAYLLVPRQRVRLDPFGYDVTMALYRVCNQRSAEGIQAIERKLMEETAPPDGQPSASLDQNATNPAIQQIIEMAKANQWTEATRRCRELLEDQVQR
ncbi:MAG: hypothetical protein R3C05_18220 [Pirellulaceae bacterium]